GRWRIAIDRTEIALTIHQRVAHGKVLRHTYDRVVHRRIAMWVIFTDDIANHTCRFFVWLVVVVTQLAHGVQHAPMHRLEPVAHVRQRAADDDAHGIVEIRLTHLLFEVDRKNLFCDVGHIRYSSWAGTAGNDRHLRTGNGIRGTAQATRAAEYQTCRHIKPIRIPYSAIATRVAAYRPYGKRTHEKQQDRPCMQTSARPVAWPRRLRAGPRLPHTSVRMNVQMTTEAT